MGIIFSTINLTITLAVVGAILVALVLADCKWTHYICKNGQITVPTSIPPIPFSQEERRKKIKRIKYQ